MGNARQRLQEAKRIVVKVGTSTLTHETGKLNLNRIDKLIREIADLKNQGKEMILVSSGAIAAGLGKLGLDKKPDSIPEKQAVAAIGQGVLMHIYEKLFAEYGQVMGQVLLTKENSVQHHQYIHSRNSLLAQLAMGAVPVINENDAVAVDEIKIGDNDNLSAMVATLVDADALI
ncbi:MAG: glutamate 5-kinase, partial [Selenomonas sp.]|nr:glutamate 5-kinase [Selenomonas sp.]